MVPKQKNVAKGSGGGTRNGGQGGGLQITGVLVSNDFRERALLGIAGLFPNSYLYCGENHPQSALLR